MKTNNYIPPIARLITLGSSQLLAGSNESEKSFSFSKDEIEGDVSSNKRNSIWD